MIRFHLAKRKVKKKRKNKKKSHHFKIKQKQRHQLLQLEILQGGHHLIYKQLIKKLEEVRHLIPQLVQKVHMPGQIQQSKIQVSFLVIINIVQYRTLHMSLYIYLSLVEGSF